MPASARPRPDLTPDYEIVLVNDGSPDDSLAVALKLLEHDDRVRIIDRPETSAITRP